MDLAPQCYKWPDTFPFQNCQKESNRNMQEVFVTAGTSHAPLHLRVEFETKLAGLAQIV